MQPIETQRAASRPECRLHVVSSLADRVAMRSESARLGAGGLQPFDVTEQFTSPLRTARRRSLACRFPRPNAGQRAQPCATAGAGPAGMSRTFLS